MRKISEKPPFSEGKEGQQHFMAPRHDYAGAGEDEDDDSETRVTHTR